MRRNLINLRAKSNKRLERTRQSAAFIRSCVGEPLNRSVGPLSMMIRRFFAFSMLFLLALSASAKTPRSRNPYPNELPGFKFYRKHLAPLRPYLSDRAQVERVLGPSQRIDVGKWRIWASSVGEGSTIGGHAWAHNIVGRLASVDIRPLERVSMLGVKFPAAFTHSVGGVSEINVSCDVYEDRFGLEYWLYAEDSGAEKKGDLMHIVYGPSERLERRIVGAP